MLAGALRRFFLQPARKFAEQMVEFDSAIGAHGLVDASRIAQRRYVKDVRLIADTSASPSETMSLNAGPIPAGPILVLSNHPGMTDTLSLFCALDRPDLKIIALDRPFLAALPNLSKQLLYVEDDPASRVRLVRQVTSHLRAGGAALTFPAGAIEPDPDVYTGAAESLESWTDSVGVFIRMAPETVILPVLVRNVIWAKAAAHPLVKLKKTRDERERLATALQLLRMVVWNEKPVRVTVQIGKPITARELGTTNTQVIHRSVLSEMTHLIENPPQSEGRSML